MLNLRPIELFLLSLAVFGAGVAFVVTRLGKKG